MKRIFGFSILSAMAFVFCLAGRPAAAATALDDEYRANMAQGIELVRSGNVEKLKQSLGRFKAALKIRPESAEAYYWIALAHSDMGNYLIAASNAKDATVYDDKMPEAWLLWGQALLYQRDWNEARLKLEEASRLDPENPLILFNLGRVYYHGFKDPDAALPKFRAAWQRGQALRRDRPEYISLVINSRLYMGYCEFDRGRWDNAISAFREVLGEQPANYDAALRLALAYRRSNRANECDQILSSLIRVVPDDSVANRRLLAEAYLQLGDLYLKDPVLKNPVFAYAHLKDFVNRIGDGNHPALEPVREYLAINDNQSAGGAR